MKMKEKWKNIYISKNCNSGSLESYQHNIGGISESWDIACIICPDLFRSLFMVFEGGFKSYTFVNHPVDIKRKQFGFRGRKCVL